MNTPPLSSPAAPTADPFTAAPAGRPGGPPARGIRAPSGKRPVLLFVVLLVVLGVGGALFGAAVGSGSASSGVLTPSAASQTRLPVQGAPANQIPTTNAALMGLAPAGGRPAYDFVLTDQRGAPVSLASLDRTHAVVLTFMDDRCQQLCPVLTSELAGADRLLGARAESVRLVVVDLDPSPGGPARIAQFLSGQGRPLAALPNFWFLTGTAASLRHVWSQYGIQSGVAPDGVTYTNESMWFVAPGGSLQYQASPFANERTNGTWWLPAPTVNQWARGIAQYATSTLGRQ